MTREWSDLFEPAERGREITAIGERLARLESEKSKLEARLDRLLSTQEAMDGSPADRGCRRDTARTSSVQLLQQLPCVSQQGLNSLSLGDRVSGEQAVPARVLVCPWCAGSRRTAVHAAVPFAAHRRRAARSAAADPGAAARARQHRTDIAGAISHACAPRLASRELCKQSCSCAPRSGVETIRASVTAGAG